MFGLDLGWLQDIEFLPYDLFREPQEEPHSCLGAIPAPPSNHAESLGPGFGGANQWMGPRNLWVTLGFRGLGCRGGVVSPFVGICGLGGAVCLPQEVQSHRPLCVRARNSPRRRRLAL